MNVLALTRYGRLGASSRVRCYQYLPHLERAGITVTPQPLFSDAYLRTLYTSGRRHPVPAVRAYLRRLGHVLRARRFDAVWLEYELFPWLPAIGEWCLGRSGVPCIVDYDDAIFHRYDLATSRWVRALLGSKIGHVMARATVVVAGNEYIAARAAAAGATHVEYIPSVVDTGLYHPGTHDRDAPVVVGWIGSPSTSHYLLPLEPVLARLTATGSCRVVLVGLSSSPFSTVDAECLPWVEAREAEDVASFDIGIMPLRDGPWERGKCGYKLIQCMAGGVPVVASPVGVNPSIVTPECGVLASTPDAWHEALHQLVSDADVRRRMGRAARDRADRHYSLDVWAPRMRAVYESIGRGA